MSNTKVSTVRHLSPNIVDTEFHDSPSSRNRTKMRPEKKNTRAKYRLRSSSLFILMWLCVENNTSCFLPLQILFYLPLFLQPVSWASRLISPSSCPTLCWASDAAPTSWTTFSSASPGSLERRWGNEGVYITWTLHSTPAGRATGCAVSQEVWGRYTEVCLSAQTRRKKVCYITKDLKKKVNHLDANDIKMVV